MTTYNEVHACNLSKGSMFCMFPTSKKWVLTKDPIEVSSTRVEIEARDIDGDLDTFVFNWNTSVYAVKDARDWQIKEE